MDSTLAIAEWQRCRGWIEAALDRDGLYGIEDIERGVEAGEMHFWPGKACAIVTEFIAYPKAKVLNIFAGGGVRGDALKELKAMEPVIVAWARTHGAKKIMSFGSHESWKPVGQSFGYRHIWTVMMKDVEQ